MTMHKKSGRIVTFYSFKGGVGRTMALANFATLLSEAPRDSRPPARVLMIDWDLEAPGLDRYFPAPPADAPPARQSPGLIELLLWCRQALDAVVSPPTGYHALIAEAETITAAVPLADYVKATQRPELFLMHAGQDNSGYVQHVTDFDWEKLHTRNPFVFRTLADRLRRDYDWTLIDSRTGHTDTSGICCALLPDTLVGICVANRQSLDGLIRHLAGVAAYRKDREFPQLRLYPLVARVESSREALRNDWRHGRQGTADQIEPGFQPAFAALLANDFGIASPDMQDYFDYAQIPHSSDYAYGERIALLDGHATDQLSLATAYRNFFDWILRDAAPSRSLAVNRLLESAGQLEQAVLGDTTTLTTAVVGLRDSLAALPTAPAKLNQWTLSGALPAALDAMCRLITTPSDAARQTRSSVIDWVIAHATFLFTHAGPAIREDLRRIATALRDQGLYDQTLTLVRAVQYAENPEPDPTEGRAWALLEGRALSDCRRDREAETALQTLADICAQALPAEHPERLTVADALAMTRYEQGNYEAAHAALVKVVDQRRDVLGAEHPDTLTSMNNLALTLFAQGDLVGARKLEETVLEVRRRTLGAEHPHTLTSMNNLATTLQAQGDLAGARERYEMVLEGLRRTLGADHPDTLTSMGNLVRTLKAQGDLAGARGLLETVLEAHRRRVRGDDHPNTLASMNALATMDYERGISLKQDQAATAVASGDIDRAEPVLRALAAEHRAAGQISAAIDVLSQLQSLAVQADRFDLAKALATEIGTLRRQRTNPPG